MKTAGPFQKALRPTLRNTGLEGF